MLQQAVDWLIFSVLGFSSSSRLAESLNFFIYDSIKILILLFAMISVLGFFRSFIPPNKVRKWLGRKNYGLSNLIASLFGAVTPFCSCSSIPIFLGFMETGVPLGVAFSFLITSPIVNEYLAVLMFAFFGWKIMLLYIINGVLLGTIIGIVLGKMGLEKHLEKDMVPSGRMKEAKFKSMQSRVVFGLNEAKRIFQKIWIWVLVGVALGAAIHNYVPQEFIQAVISKGGIFTVPIAVLLGVPMYGSCAAIVPIAVALFQKGVPLGTALAFMTAISALSLPEAVILRRAMKLKLILIFFGIVALGIVFIGYLFNFFQPLLIG